jgi:hypothetical protein
MSWVVIFGLLLAFISALVAGIWDGLRCIKNPLTPEAKRMVQKINAAWEKHK